MEVKEMNIYQKMAAITAELKAVEKDLTVQTTKTSSYKAVSEKAILDAIKPLETKYGVYSFPVAREVLESNLIQNESVYEDAKGNKTTTPKTSYMTRIKTVYRFVNIDNPIDFIETTTFAEGIDNQDKGSGKAMTYADKYALMKSYKISTGEDVDEGTDAETLDCSSIFEKFSFIGNYATVEAKNLDANMGYFNLTSGAWSKMETINPFRFYMQIKLRNGAAFEYPADPQAIRMRSVNANGEETTGINGVDAEQAGDFIFDIHGRRVLETEKGGIYIKNGQKFIAQ